MAERCWQSRPWSRLELNDTISLQILVLFAGAVSAAPPELSRHGLFTMGG